MDNNKKAWGGRFSEALSKDVETLTTSLPYDWVLFHQDIAGSMAHANMLAHIGVLSETECDMVLGGLAAIEKEIAEGSFVFDPAHEDIHMAIEHALVEKIGSAGKKLHTGRSRNDQIALDMRLFLHEKARELSRKVVALQQKLWKFSDAHKQIILPEFTHLQHAQPVLLAHHMLAYITMFSRDRARISDAMGRMMVMPLGSGACVGSGLPLDREFVAKELGFARLTENSVDAVSDRDFIIELLAAISILAMHLSRLCEEWIIWSSTEFSFLTFSDAFCTGSSMMPQKKNPDVLELVRGKTGKMYGALMSVLVMMKGLPLAYNRDMQEDKLPVMEAVKDMLLCLSTMSGLVETTQVNAGICRAQAEAGFAMATDITDMMVKKGCPFREAHHVVGQLVALCIEKGCEPVDLDMNTVQTLSPFLEKSMLEHINLAASVASKDILGGTAPRQVEAQLSKWEADLFHNN